MKVELETLAQMNTLVIMNKVELVAAVDELSEDERSYLSAYLKMKERLSDASYREEMSKRLKSMQAGHAVSRDQVFGLHGHLAENGL